MSNKIGNHRTIKLSKEACGRRQHTGMPGCLRRIKLGHRGAHEPPHHLWPRVSVPGRSCLTWSSPAGYRLARPSKPAPELRRKLPSSTQTSPCCLLPHHSRQVIRSSACSAPRLITPTRIIPNTRRPEQFRAIQATVPQALSTARKYAWSRHSDGRVGVPCR